jgi:hypothetical protein
VKKVLILYPHGLGDCILLTPALREFYKTTGNKCSVAILEKFQSSEIFDRCPYIDKIFYTKDAWHDFENEIVGFRTLYQTWKNNAIDMSYQGFCMPTHNNSENKILVNMSSVGIRRPQECHTDIFTSEQDKALAVEIVRELVGDNKFGFVQTIAGHQIKNLPEGYGRKWLLENKGLENVIEIGKEVGLLEYNINVQFEILRLADAVCLPDSVFYHACHAIDKPVDFVYFARGTQVYERVRPIHEVVENVVFELQALK